MRTMYGFVLQSFINFVVKTYPSNVVDDIFTAANNYYKAAIGERCEVERQWTTNFEHYNFRGFSIYKQYSDVCLFSLIEAIVQVTGVSLPDVTEQFAPEFLEFVIVDGEFGGLLNLFGRNFNDFIKNLDDLHEHLRFTFPHMNPPSLMVTEKTLDGMKVLYKSHRPSLEHFAATLLKSVAERFYGIPISTKVKPLKHSSNGLNETTIELMFDNTGQYIRRQKTLLQIEGLNLIGVNAAWFFYSATPFHLAFIKDEFRIVSIGKSLARLFPDAVGSSFFTTFSVLLPKKDSWSWNEVITSSHTILEIEGSLLKENNVLSFKMRGQIVTFNNLGDLAMFIGTPCFEEITDLRRFDLRGRDLAKTDACRIILSATLHQHGKTVAPSSWSKNSACIVEKERQIDENMAMFYHILENKKRLLLKTIPDHLVNTKGFSPEKTLQVETGFVGVATLQLDFDTASKNSNFASSVRLYVAYLNHLSEKIDAFVEDYKLTKIGSISDELILVAGLPALSKTPVKTLISAVISIMTGAVTLSDLLNEQEETNLRRKSSVKNNKNMIDQDSYNIISAPAPFLPRPDIYIAVDCGNAASSLITMEKVKYYCVTGKPVSNSQRLVSLSPANVVAVTRAAKQNIVETGYEADYKFESLGSDCERLNDIEDIFRVTKYPEMINIIKASQGSVSSELGTQASSSPCENTSIRNVNQKEKSDIICKSRCSSITVDSVFYPKDQKEVDEKEDDSDSSIRPIVDNEDLIGRTSRLRNDETATLDTLQVTHVDVSCHSPRVSIAKNQKCLPSDGKCAIS